MKRQTALLNWLSLERGDQNPLYEQIANQIRDAILSGQLAPGMALPASRALACEIGVSRITTMRAYEQLGGEGFLSMRTGVGTWVAQGLAGAPFAKLADARRKSACKIDTKSKHVLKLYDDQSTSLAFQPGIPSFDAFPRGLWSRILSRQALDTDPFILDYAHVGGYGKLREEIAKYLRSSRGVVCEPEQIIVVTSVRAAIAAVSAVCWKRGSRIAVEDPGYAVARHVLAQSGCQVLPVATDRAGMRVDDLIDAPKRCDGAYLTPAHHWPTGVTLTAERRLRLLDWAIRRGTWIIEDDYDSEFRFESPPLGALHAFGSGRTIYVGTFSKTFAPSIRTAYLVVPRGLVPSFEKFCFYHATEPALHIQAGLAEFMARGHFTRHIGRMRKLYARRRGMLIDAVRNAFGDRIRLEVPPGGLQIIAHLPDHIPAARFVEKAAEVRVFLRSLTGNYVVQTPPNALHVGFAAVPEEQIEPAVTRLAEALRGDF